MLSKKLLMRLFFAIPVPGEIKTKLLSAFPAKAFPGIRFIAAENLHITVHFLGSTEKEKLNLILLQAKKTAERSSAFEIKFHSLKTIFKQRKPVMIWAQFENNKAFESLCSKFQNEFPTGETRTPNPHITLARIKQLKQLPFEIPELKTFSFVADSVQLFESFTYEDGAKYKMIDEWELKPHPQSFS